MRDLTDKSWQHILPRHYNLDVVAIQVLVQRAERLVLRIETPTQVYALKAAHTPEPIHQEVTNNARLAAAGLPVARVIGTGDMPVAHVLHNWIEGDALDASMPPAVLKETAHLLYTIHQLNGKPPYAGNDTWDAWMRGWLHHALPWWKKTAAIPEKQIEEVWHVFDALQPMLSQRGHGFILFDGRPEHFIVAHHKVAGLIDLGEARSGDPAMDFGVLAANAPDLTTKILKHYLPLLDASASRVFNTLVPFYTFLRLLALAEWQITHGDANIAQSCLARIATREGWPDTT